MTLATAGMALGVSLGAVAFPLGEADAARPKRCLGELITIWGTAGDDTIVGTNGEDVIIGMGGFDTIYGLDGNDHICGNAGKDVIWGDHPDSATGGSDHILPGGGLDVVHGGPQGSFGDTIDYRDAGGNMIIKLNTGAARRYVNKKDTFDGFENAFGTKFDDKINGTTGNNRLYGGFGNGKDEIWSEGGSDKMWGMGGTGDVCHGINAIPNLRPGVCGGDPKPADMP